MKTLKSILVISIASFGLLSVSNAQIFDSPFTSVSEYSSNKTITFTNGAVSSGNPAVTIGGTENTITVEGTADLSSGTFSTSSYNLGNTVLFKGGTMGDVYFGNNIQGFMTGGTFVGELSVTNNSTLDILSGTFGSGFSLFVEGLAVTNISGSYFALDGVPLTSDTITGTEFGATTGLLTGFLADNSPFSMAINANDLTSTINLTAVPEPSTVIALVGGIGLLAVLSRKRKRTAVA